MAKDTPLVYDVDGTFLRTDMLFECLWAGIGKAPGATFRTVWAHWHDRATLKRKLAEIAELRVDLLPVNQQLKELADENIAGGRRVVLASASDRQLVSALAEHHGLDPMSLGSDDGINLKGAAKAERLVAEFGEDGFDYAGDSRADMEVWPHSQNALLVGGSAALKGRLSAMGKNIAEVPGGWKFRALLKAMRPHQWVKNVLLFLPMLAAHDFAFQTFFLTFLGMIAFSAAASSIYIVNDLIDLEADRLHATKYKRPLASGAVPISVGMVTLLILALVAIGIGSLLGPLFLTIVVGYMVLSLGYSLRWKRLRWIDIGTLASLYTIRVVAGAAATMVPVTGAMLVFVFPIFFTLGCVKRLTELTLAEGDERLPGRGYARSDRGDLLNMAWLGVVGALVTFFVYSLSEHARSLYPTRWLLWVALLPMFLWLLRMVRLGYFGKQDYDPIVFALRDKRGLGLLALILSIMFFAAGLFQEWFGL